MSRKKKIFYSKTPQVSGEWASDQEFLRVERAIRELSNLLPTETTTSMPTASEQFEIRYADGSNWNPGQGEGLYTRINNQWRKFTLT